MPIGLRPTLYGFYASIFQADLDEIELDLSAFPNLVEFFVRKLKHNARPIAQEANLVNIQALIVFQLKPCIKYVRFNIYKIYEI